MEVKTLVEKIVHLNFESEIEKFLSNKTLNSSQLNSTLEQFGAELLQCENVTQICNLLTKTFPGLSQSLIEISQCQLHLPLELEVVVWELKNLVVTKLKCGLFKLRRDQGSKICGSMDDVSNQISVLHKTLEEQKNKRKERNKTEQKENINDRGSKEWLYSKGYILVEAGTSESSPIESYIFAVLQLLTQNFAIFRHSSINSMATFAGAQDWNVVTTTLGDINKSNQILHELSTFAEKNLSMISSKSEEIRKSCNSLILSTFGNRVVFEVIQDLSQLPSESNENNVKYLFEESNLFWPIVKRNLVHKDPKSLLLSIIEDFSFLPTLENYFLQTLLQINGDTFDRRLAANPILQCLEGSTSFSQIRVSLPSKWFQEDVMLKMMVEVEELCKDSGFLEARLRDFKSTLIKGLERAVEQLVLGEREQIQLKTMEMREASELAEMEVKTIEEILNEKRREIRDFQKTNNEQENLIARLSGQTQMLHKIQIVKQTLRSARSDNLDLLAPQIAETRSGEKLSGLLLKMQNESSFAPQNFNEIVQNIKDWSQESVADVVSLVKYLFEVKPELDENGDQVTFRAHHLVVSNCISKAVQFINQINQKERKKKSIQIHFVGTETILIDEDFQNDIYHGVSLTFVAPAVRLRSTVPGNPIRINVSGKDGEAHEETKPPKPSAFGAEGIKGYPGDDGESGGHVVIMSRESSFVVELLHVRSIGGNGANGQNGGDGGDGQDGSKGKDGQVSKTHPTGPGERSAIDLGLPGTMGRNGGNGAQGGKGGKAGRGGSICVDRGGRKIEATPEKSEIIKMCFETKNGNPGNPGRPGEGGCPGKGGAHGLDVAWTKASRWFWDPWIKTKGTLELIYHATFWKRGYTVKTLKPKGPAQNGQWGMKGRVVKRANLGEHLAPSKSFPEPNHQMNTRQENHFDRSVVQSPTTFLSQFGDDQSFVNENQSYHSSLAGLQRVRDESHEIQRQTEEETLKGDELLKTALEFKEMCEQAQTRMEMVAYQRAVQNHDKVLIQDFSGRDTPLEKEVRSKDDCEEKGVEYQTEYQLSEILNWVKPFKIVLDKQQSGAGYAAYEKCIMKLLRAFNIPNNVPSENYDKLVELVTSLEADLQRGPWGALSKEELLEVIGNQFPEDYAEFRDVEANWILPPEHAHPDLILCLYTTNFSKEDLTAIETLVRDSTTLNNGRKERLLKILEPAWTTRILEKCVVGVSKAAKKWRATDLLHKRGYHLPNPVDSVQVEEVCKNVILQMIRLQRTLFLHGDAKKTEQFRTEFVANEIETFFEKLRPEELPSKVESAVDLIFTKVLEMDLETLLLSPKAPYSTVKFITTNFRNVKPHHLSELANTFASKVHVVKCLEKVYESRFRKPLLQRLVPLLKGVGEQSAIDDITAAVVEVAEAYPKFEKRMEIYNNFLNQLSRSSRRVGVEELVSELRSEHFMSKQMVYKHLKQREFKDDEWHLLLASIRKMTLTPEEYIKFESVFKQFSEESTSSQISQFDEAVQSFWNREMTSVLDLVITLFDRPSWFDKLETSVFDVVDYSTKLLEQTRTAVMPFLKLKLLQIHYWMVAQSRFSEVETLGKELEGVDVINFEDEVDYLASVLMTLEKFRTWREDPENPKVGGLWSLLSQFQELESDGEPKGIKDSKQLLTEMMTSLREMKTTDFDANDEELVEVRLVPSCERLKVLEQLFQQKHVLAGPSDDAKSNWERTRSIIFRRKKSLKSLLSMMDAMNEDNFEAFSTRFEERIADIKNVTTRSLQENARGHLEILIKFGCTGKRNSDQKEDDLELASEASFTLDKSPVATYLHNCHQSWRPFRETSVLELEESAFRVASESECPSPWWLPKFGKNDTEESTLPRFQGFQFPDTLETVGGARILSEMCLRSRSNFSEDDIKTLETKLNHHVENRLKSNQLAFSVKYWLQQIRAVLQRDPNLTSTEKELVFLQVLVKLDKGLNTKPGLSTLRQFWRLIDLSDQSDELGVNVPHFLRVPELPLDVRELTCRQLLNAPVLEPKLFEAVRQAFVKKECPTDDKNTWLLPLMTRQERGSNFEDFDVSSLLEQSQWHHIFDHHSVTLAFRTLIQSLPSDQRGSINDALSSWSKELQCQGSLHQWSTLMLDYTSWIKGCDSFTYNELLSFISIASTLNLIQLQSILEESIPPNYTYNCCLLRLQTILSGTSPQIPDDNYLPSLTRLKESLAHFPDRGAPILKTIVEQLPSLETSAKQDFFKDLIESIYSLPPSPNNKEQMQVVNKLVTSPISEWLKILSQLYYIRLFAIRGFPKLNHSVSSLASEAERTSTREHTSKFVMVMTSIAKQKNTMMPDAIFKQSLQKLVSGDWILRREILDQFETVDTFKEFSELMTKFAEKVDKMVVEGEELVLKFKNLPQNKKHVSNINSLLLNPLSDIRATAGKYSGLLKFQDAGPIGEWTPETITLWSCEVRKSHKFEVCRSLKVEVLAIICQAVVLWSKDKNIVPHDTQLAAVLMVIDAVIKGKGRFGEIATSEGKTLISAITAFVLALSGHNVNVISSSPILADDACKKMASLFAMFGIEASNICDSTSRRSEHELELRYKKQVLYGDTSSFQTDFLNFQYMDKPFGHREAMLIVDEVDSILLDKGSNVLYISHEVPELRWLRPVFLFIWGCVLADESHLDICRRAKARFLPKEGPLTFPKFLTKFVGDRIPVWVNNARMAQAMDRDVPYVVSPDKVTIVDLDTGIYQDNMQYSYGLHQFLQLKHGNKLSSESLKAVFVSNLGYFSKFKGKIFGITGTIGEHSAQNLLSDLYNVDFFKMPRFRNRVVVRKEGILCNSEESHLNAIQEAVTTATASQPILIICENVKSAELIYRKLIETGNKDKIQLYVDSHEESKNDTTLAPEDVMVSTNLAGRGMDLPIDENCVPGLFVILSYIPPNTRVEKQAFGRTARMGRKGSTQYIVKTPPGLSFTSVSQFQAVMTVVEAKRLESIRNKEVPRILLEESLLAQFFEFEKKFMTTFQHNMQPFASKQLHKTIRDILKNNWALWLDEAQEKLALRSEKCEKVLGESLSQFCRRLELGFGTEMVSLCRTPSSFVKLARAYETSKNWNKSACILEAGLEFEPKYTEICHYYLATTILKQGKSRKLAQSHYKLARQKIEERIEELGNTLSQHKTLCAIWKGDDKTKSSFATSTQFQQQIHQEIGLLQIHIRECLDVVLGYSLTPDSFKGLLMVNNDEVESAQIYNILLQSGLLKPLRLSSKLSLLHGKLHWNEKKFEGFKSANLKTIEDPLKVILVTKLTRGERKIEASDFENLIMTRKSFIEALTREGFFENMEARKELEVTYNENAFLRDPVKSVVVGQMLAGKMARDGVTFERQWLKDLKLGPEPVTEHNAIEIEEELKNKGHLTERTHWKCVVDKEKHSKLKVKSGKLEGLPESLLGMESLIGVWLLEFNTEGEMTEISRQVDTSSRLPLPHDDEEGASGGDNSEGEIQVETSDGVDVISYLVDEGIVKRSCLKWNLEDNFGKEKKVGDAIKAKFEKGSSVDLQLQELFHSKRGHNEEDASCEKGIVDKIQTWVVDHLQNEGRKYVEAIRDEVLQSAGLLKTVGDLEISKDYKSIITHLPDPPPVEVYDTILNEDFDRIPDIRKRVPWWCSGATWVAVLGILQIAAGVTIGILSGGTLVNVAAMFITEGGSDMLFATQTGLRGNFSWRNYGIHKAFSVGASILTGGLAGVTGASLTNIALMEVTEEILKKVVLTVGKHVGRYAVQGIGSTLVNMGIEKVLDKVRSKILGLIRNSSKLFLARDESYRNAKQRLNAALQRLYAASYRKGQVEQTATFARQQIGPGNQTSILATAFFTSVQRVVSFFTAKISAKLGAALGSGVLANLMKLYNLVATVTKGVAQRGFQVVQKMASDYVQRLTEYFEGHAEILEKKQTVRATNLEVGEKQKFEEFAKMYLAKVDNDVVEDGVAKLQTEFLEPCVMQAANRCLEAGCHRLFEGSQNNFLPTSRDKKKGNKTFWDRMKTPSVHHATELSFRAMNEYDATRGGVSAGNANNLWNELEESLEGVGERLEAFCQNIGGKNATAPETTIFVLSEASRGHLAEAENLGLAIVRRFKI